ARHVLDHPELVRGRRVLDFATGSGLVAIAAARAGAARVVATDVAPFCEAVVPMNAALNGVTLELRLEDLLGVAVDGFDVVLAGDVFYEQPLASRAEAWLRGLAGRGVTALAGDPGRLYSPRTGTRDRGHYDVPVSEEIESRPVMRTWIVELAPG
ncbi:MAG TPA: 50S ribosomal protein L11 methyltransferase, partial [Anaeromyxobacteraceae bacterium]|nr:50S ribosomal protein L11 methyltransferase [Anaeromyxobacteraceae bacterium]